jgi:hypothetical protein
MILVSYGALAVAVLLSEFIRKKRYALDYFTYFNAYFVLTYVLTPIYLYTNVQNNQYEGWTLSVFVVTLAAYFCSFAGWALCPAKNERRIQRKSTSIRNLRARVRYMGWCCAFVAVVAITYTIGKGGLVALLSSGALVRYGYKDSTSTFVDFLWNVFSSVEIVTYVLFAMKLSEKYLDFKKAIGVMYYIALSLSIIYIISGSSRGAVANMVIIHSLIYVFFRRNSGRIAIILAPLSVVLTLYGKQLFFALASFLDGAGFADSFLLLNEQRNLRTDNNSVADKLFAEFVHAPKSLQMAMFNEGGIAYTYFTDFPLSLLRIIPQRLRILYGNIPETISSINTDFLTGERVASAPPGLLGHFHYSMGFLGVLIGSFAYGYLGKKVNDHMYQAVKDDNSTYALYAFMALTYGSFVSNGDPNVYIYSILWPIVLFGSLRRRHEVSSPLG